MVTIGALLADPKYPEKLILQKLFCAYTSCSKEDLWMKTDEEMSDEMIKNILEGYASYVKDKKPLEYILGYVEFFGRKFFVNEATLIPRPETEYMITAVTEYIQEQGTKDKGQSNLLLDIGTGCGVLGISVLLQNPGYFSDAVFSDYYENALEVAKKNYGNLVKSSECRVRFLHSDLLDFLVHGNGEKSSTLKDTPSFQIKEDTNVVLVANLPYIPEETFEQNVADNVKNREPKPAFVGGDDGLDYYRVMLKQILDIRHKYQDIRQKKDSLDTGYLIPVTMFLEMMTWQVDVLRQEFGQSFEFEEVKTFHFNIRIVKVFLK